jgi:hypothetical protein
MHRKIAVIGLFVVAVILLVVQAAIWRRTAERAHSETDKQNIEILQPPNENPGLAGITLLVLAGVLASIPRRAVASKH